MQARTGRPGKSLLAILLVATGIGPLLSYGLNAASDLVISELGLSEAQFGLLATACFACAALGNAAFGRFADRQPDSRLMVLVFAMATLALVLAAIPGGYVLLLVASGMAGLAQSFPNGVTNRILTERVPADKRIGWIGIKQSGVQVSQLVASLGFPALAAWIGWHGASAVGAVLAGLLGIVAVRVLSSVPLLPAPLVPVTPAASAPDAAAPAPTNIGFLIGALAAFGFVNGMGVQATNVYLSLFAVREMGFTLVLGGMAAAMAGAIGVTARVGWGRMMSRGIAAPPLLLLLASMAFAGALVFTAAGATGSAALLWLAVALHGASALGVSVVLMAAVVRSVPASSMARATGLVSAGQFGGFTIGPLAMGALIGSPGGFTLGWSVTAGVYLLCVLLALYLVVRRRRQGRAA
ncbi:MFS transporter [Paeniglutamicibacter cryotolerans]|uniref:MFS family permease n=1 Tax=Paeniglutamicibacter cryotolerans TaxID=670079 RepID=A0A839QU78_9MICC|nr:MFS transporter [Paeniglutamicibacter cryotolerans]MBB2996822.1 MFS family permease [Paeniglutamicibacter cryotolerans]